MILNKDGTNIYVSSYPNMEIELKISVPEGLSDITLEEYQKYVDVINKADLDNPENNDFVNLKALEIFCGLQLKESYKLPLHSFDDILNKVYGCLNEETPLIKRFWFRGSNGEEVEFGMIPDLQNISFGEYIDLENYISDWKNMHKAMAVLFRPITAQTKELYDIEEYEGSKKYAHFMKHMPVSVALGAMVFFYRLGMKLSRHTMNSSFQKMTKDQLLKVESKFLEKNGVGINQFMLSLEEMYSNLNKLPKLGYTAA
tara:strand:+ start:270 stop:1040 length:771 start_codon:yes stop_codon:yes gene_type:complete